VKNIIKPARLSLINQQPSYFCCLTAWLDHSCCSKLLLLRKKKKRGKLHKDIKPNTH